MSNKVYKYRESVNDMEILGHRGGGYKSSNFFVEKYYFK